MKWTKHMVILVCEGWYTFRFHFINRLAHWAGCSDCNLRQSYFVLDKYLVINHDFRFLAPICICALEISKYLLIFGFVTFHIWKNLNLRIEKTHFQKPTLFVW